MKHDHRAIGRRLRQNRIQAEKDAFNELRKIEDLIELSEQRDKTGRLTSAAHQARQARKNPFSQTTARSQARRNCEQKLRDAEHDAAIAYQELFICLEKARYRAELLQSFDEPQVIGNPGADVCANEGYANPTTFAAPYMETGLPNGDRNQRWEESLTPYEIETKTGFSSILGPTHPLMFAPSANAEKLAVMAGLTPIECEKLALFGAPNQPVASLEGCDLGLLIRAMINVAVVRLHEIETQRSERHFASHTALMAAAEELALWWLFHQYYRSNPRMAQLCPKGLFHNVEGPDWAAHFQRPGVRSHERIFEPNMRSIEFDTDPDMLHLLFDLSGLRKYGKLKNG